MSQPTPSRPPAPPAARPAGTMPSRPSGTPQPPRRGNSLFSRLPDGTWKLLVAGAVIIALGVACHFIWPHGFVVGDSPTVATERVTEIHGSGPVRINELMSKNATTAVDENGITADWVEVANVGSSAVNLYGYALAKDEKAVNIFRFPDLTLAPGECALVFADSTAGESPAHAPFKLSSQGGTLMLFNRRGSVIDSVNYPAMSADISYVRRDSATWEVSDEATPGRLNTEENYQSLHTADASAPVEITEVLAANTQYGPDENDTYHDYFELHNRTGEPVDLSGWFVSDDAARPVKWRLPDGFVLQPGEYRLVYADKLDRPNADYPHTSFGLSSGGEAVVLSDARGQLVDVVTFGQMQTDIAWLKQPDGTWASGTPSPGAANE